ncbi:MAG: flagellar FliJ family protein [Acidobacteriaceae bacterium]
MAFESPLSAVLRVRESIERREERALHKIRSAVVRAEDQMKELGAAMDRARGRREAALRGSISGGQLQALLDEEEWAEQRRKTLRGKIQMLRQELERQIQAYQTAHQEREMLSGMLQRQREAFERRERYEEQKRLDDVFLARRSRR